MYGEIAFPFYSPLRSILAIYSYYVKMASVFRVLIQASPVLAVFSGIVLKTALYVGWIPCLVFGYLAAP